MIDAAKVRRESLRWYVLLALYNNRPEDMCEEHLQMIATGIFPDATPIELRQQLDYLSDRKLVEIRKEPIGRWWAGLTRYGTDVAEYTVDCEPGIARPVKYWAS